MKRAFYIDYPQEHFEEQLHRYRCSYCKVETTVINGRLDGHTATCPYRLQLAKAGHQAASGQAPNNSSTLDADDFD